MCAYILQFLDFFVLLVRKKNNFFPKNKKKKSTATVKIYVSGTNGMILCLCECVYVSLFNFTFPSFAIVRDLCLFSLSLTTPATPYTHLYICITKFPAFI